MGDCARFDGGRHPECVGAARSSNSRLILLRWGRHLETLDGLVEDGGLARAWPVRWRSGSCSWHRVTSVLGCRCCALRCCVLSLGQRLPRGFGCHPCRGVSSAVDSALSRPRDNLIVSSTKFNKPYSNF